MSFNKVVLLFFFSLTVLLCSQNAYSEIKYIETNAKGRGENFEVALKKAFKDAISKINGVTLETESLLETIDKSVTTNEESSATLSRNFQETISEKTKGSIKSFDVLNEYKDENGIYIVEINAIVASMSMYSNDGETIKIVPIRETRIQP